MNESDLKIAYIKHEANRFISAALMAFSKAIDKAIQNNERVVGKVYQVTLLLPKDPVVARYIIEKMNSSRGKFARYHVKLGKVALRIFAEIIAEPTDLGGVVVENEQRITDAILQEKENNPTNLDDLPVEHIQLTKEDLEDDTVH